MRLAPLVQDAVLGARAHARGAHVVRRRVGRGVGDPDRSDGAVELSGVLPRVGAHRHVVGVVVEVDVRDRQPVLVEHVGVQRDPVGRLRHVLAHDPQPGRVLVAVHDLGELRAPGTGVGEGSEEGRAQRQGLHVVAPDEAALLPQARLISDDAGHGLAAVHVDRLLEARVARRGEVAHVVASHLPRAVGHAVREQRRAGEQQQAGRLDRVGGHAHDAGSLALQGAVLEVEDPVGLAGRVVGDLGSVAVGPQVQVAGLLGLGQLGDQGRPLRPGLVALEVEAVLVGRGPTVERGGVRGVRTGGVLLVADLLRAVGHDLVVVVRRQRGTTVTVRDTHADLGVVVVRLHLGQRDRPVQQRGPLDVAVGGLRRELVLLEARAGAGPVGRGAADGLDGPGRQVREVLRDPVAPGGRAHVGPGHLVEGRPLVVVVVRAGQVRTGLQDHDAHAGLAQVVGQGAATGARADDDDDVRVGVLETGHALISSMRGSGSQSRSSKPRST